MQSFFKTPQTPQISFAAQLLFEQINSGTPEQKSSAIKKIAEIRDKGVGVFLAEIWKQELKQTPPNSYILQALLDSFALVGHDATIKMLEKDRSQIEALSFSWKTYVLANLDKTIASLKEHPPILSDQGIQFDVLNAQVDCGKKIKAGIKAKVRGVKK